MPEEDADTDTCRKMQQEEFEVLEVSVLLSGMGEHLLKPTFYAVHLS